MVIRFYGEKEILRNFQVLPIRLKKVTPHFVNFHISTSSIQHRNSFHNILSSAGLNGGKKRMKTSSTGRGTIFARKGQYYRIVKQLQLCCSIVKKGNFCKFIASKEYKYEMLKNINSTIPTNALFYHSNLVFICFHVELYNLIGLQTKI